MSENTSDSQTREYVIKARIAGEGVSAPSAMQDDAIDALQKVFKRAGVLTPPYDPRWLMKIAENSSALNQNVEAYMTNIDGLGYRLEPIFDFQAADIVDQVREAMWVSNGKMDAEPPGDEEVNTQIKVLRRQARFEELKFNGFLQFINPDGSFTSLRRETRQHLEITGNAYWEILRNREGAIARAMLVPSTHMRLTAADEDPIEVEDTVRVGQFQESTVTQYRFFRRFVQAIGNSTVYFKEFGDPRIVSRKTGKVYPDIDSFEKARTDETDAPANEILHFKLPRPGEAYGIPRWIGSLLSVLGSRAADEVNYDYFDNKAIPPLALLVQGGRIGADDVTVIRDYIQNHIKGRQNFHKILIIEAVADAASTMSGVTTQPTLKFERLSDQQLSEGQFQKYDERNIDKIGSAFRLPRLIRGDVRDFNKATAAASLRFSEEQVFAPERGEFDALFNRKVLPELGITLWRFKTLGNRTRDPDVVSEIVERLVKAHVLSVNEGREIIADAMGIAVPSLPFTWAKHPIELVLAGMVPEGGTGEEQNDAMRMLVDEAQQLAAGHDKALGAAKDKAVEDQKTGLKEEQTGNKEG